MLQLLYLSEKWSPRQESAPAGHPSRRLSQPERSGRCFFRTWNIPKTGSRIPIEYHRKKSFVIIDPLKESQRWLNRA